MSPARPHTERWAYRWLYSARVFELTARLFPLLGRAGFHLVSRSVAAFYSHTQPAVVETVRSNLKLLGGQPTRKSAREVFQNFATIIADYTALASMPASRALDLCAEFEGRQHLEAAAAAGGILATGHFGFFEYGAVVLGNLGIPLTIATLPEPRPSLSAWRARWRQRWNAETIEIRADPFASLEVRHAIERGRLAAVLADRPDPSQALSVEMPGGRMAFSTTPAVLAIATARPIIPTVIFLRPGNLYHVRALPALTPPARLGGDKRSHIRTITRQLAEALTNEFAQHPTQWFQFAPLPAASLS